MAALDRGADGKFSKRDSSHFVLFQDVDIDETAGLRGSRRFEQDVLKALEVAYRRADELLGLRPERPITVVVYDPDVFDAQFAGLLKFPAAGFYGGRVHVRGGDLVSRGLIQVLNHEHIHAAFDAEAPRVILPAWFNEGLAEWFEASAAGGGGLTSSEKRSLAAAAAQGQLFSLAQLSSRSFAPMGPGSARLAYAHSHAFIDFLAETYGERRLREWVAATLRGADLERATRRVYRADLSALEERFRAGWESSPGQ
ncbi:MAG: peptidase MA family metallohydrolase [Myxococcota bacterium]|nr:peptidase MA family metallohydrolase [Myxococcota bacterium]